MCKVALWRVIKHRSMRNKTVHCAFYRSFSICVGMLVKTSFLKSTLSFHAPSRVQRGTLFCVFDQHHKTLQHNCTHPTPSAALLYNRLLFYPFMLHLYLFMRNNLNISFSRCLQFGQNIVSDIHFILICSRDLVWSVLTGHWKESIPPDCMREIKELETWILMLLSSPVPVPGKTKVQLEVRRDQRSPFFKDRFSLVPDKIS